MLTVKEQTLANRGFGSHSLRPFFDDFLPNSVKMVV
jgi:hypothetical protein